jgi:hypothetical protein
MAQKLKTTFVVEGSGRSLVMVPADFTVQQFIQLVNARLHRTDLRFASLEGSQLLDDEELQPFWSESAVFNITRAGAASSSAPNPPRPPLVMGPPPGGRQTAGVAPDRSPPDEEGELDESEDLPSDPPRPAASAAPARPTRKYEPVRHQLPDAGPIGSDCFRVFTSLSLDSMVVGRDIPLQLDLGVAETASAILGSLGGLIPANPSVLLYLGCGVPFLGGTLGNFVSAFPRVARVIYAVVSEHIDSAVLSAEYTELCDVSDAGRQRLLSPMFQSTESGFTQIAALLGYVNHGGVNRDQFIAAMAQLTGFAPLVAGLHRIAKNERIFGRDVLSVTSSLFGFVQAFVGCAPDKVFDYLLRVGSFAIAGVETDDVLLPIRVVTVDSSSGEAGQQYYAGRGLSSVRVWQPDTGVPWPRYRLERPESRAIIENAFDEGFTALRPVAPANLRQAASATIYRSGQAGCHCSWLRGAMAAVGSRASTSSTR